MKSIWGPVRAVKAFAQNYGFIGVDPKERISLTDAGSRLLKHTDNARADFLVLNIKLQDQEPFLFLKQELAQKKTLKIGRIGELLQLKFRPKEKWSAKQKDRIGNVYSDWLVYLRQAKRKDDSLEYAGGFVKTFEVLIIPEMCSLLDRSLYDWFVEHFHTPHNILDEPYQILEKVEKTTDSNECGKLFENFVGSCFVRFGFSPRLTDGVREKHTNLTYQREGGGDVGLFCHFPTPATNKVHQGYAISCEAKSSTAPIGSKAVGQARNLSKKISEVFPDYLIHTVVVSRSISGYDSSGKEQATPEVIHLSHKVLLSLLELQKERLKSGLPLIIAPHFMIVLNELIHERNLEPDSDEFTTKILSLKEL